MSTLGFDEDEQMCILRTVAGILHFGNIEVKQRPREEWATIPTTTGTYVRTWPVFIRLLLCVEFVFLTEYCFQLKFATEYT